MRTASFKSGPWVLGIALAAAPWATAAQPPSIIRHTAIKDPWTVGIEYSRVNPGKIKIFDKEPRYLADGSLSMDSIPVAELRNSKQSYKLARTVTTYWLVTYPEKGLVNLTVTFHKDNTQPASDAKVKITQGIVKDVGATPAVLKVSPSAKAKFHEENYENARGGPFVVLD